MLCKITDKTAIFGDGSMSLKIIGFGLPGEFCSIIPFISPHFGATWTGETTAYVKVITDHGVIGWINRKYIDVF